MPSPLLPPLLERPPTVFPWASPPFLLLLLSLLPLSALSNSIAPFLADLTPVLLPATSSVNLSDSLTLYSHTFPIAFAYLNTSLLLYTNATSITATLSTSTLQQLPSSASFTSYPLPYVPSTLLLSFTPDTPYTSSAALCASYLPSLCPLNVTLSASLPYTSTPPSFLLSTYSLSYLPLGSSATAVTNAGRWRYYSTYITSDDLNVEYDLQMSTPDNLPRAGIADVDFYLSSDSSPLLALFPDPNNPADYHPPGTEEAVLLTSGGSDGFTDGIYITGVYSPPSSSFQTEYWLQVEGGFDRDGSALTASLYYIIAALAILVVCLCGSVCLVAQRRRSAIREFNQSMAAAAIAEDVEMMRRLQMMAAARGLTAAALTPIPAISQGATEEEIRGIPEWKWVRHTATPSAGGKRADEVDEDEDARCSVCLDEYEGGVSFVKKLNCGHIFHSQCINTWLQQKRHCPLCLQNVKDAHNVKRVNAAAEGVEVRPLIGGAKVREGSISINVPVDDEPNVVSLPEEERKEQ